MKNKAVEEQTSIAPKLGAEPSLRHREDDALPTLGRARRGKKVLVSN